LKLINVNCQSIANKKGDIQNLIDQHDPDIICATETWLSKEHKDGEICFGLLDKYDIHRHDREFRQGGGVLIASKKELQAEFQPNLETNCESIWVSIKLQAAKTLYVCCYYRPNCQDETSCGALRDAICRISPHSNIIIAGDFNYPDIDWQTKATQSHSTTRRLSEEFIDFIDDFALTQLVNTPTRHTKTLDLLLTNAPGHCKTCNVIPGISDHEAVAAVFEFNAVRHKQPARQIPLYSKANWEGFHNHMLDHHNRLLEEGISGTTVDQVWNKFKYAIHDGAKRFIPHKTARSINKKPWIKRDTKRLIRQKSRAYYKQRKSQSQQDQDRYRDLKHKTQKKIRQDYWLYVEDMVTPDDRSSTRTASKKFWTFVKHSRQDSVGIPNLMDKDGTEHITPLDKAEALNCQFSSVFSSLKPSSLKDLAARLIPSRYTRMPSLCISTAGISKLLCDLDKNKAPGPDGIQPRILKQLHFAIAPTLQVIFEKSYREGSVPEDWKKANICPIFKKGAKSDPTNYRPVSLTCIASKMFEHIVTSNIMSHLDNHEILYKKQHGFRRGRSCESQLLELTHDLQSGLHEGKQTDLIIMDFAKAFDKVSHEKLLTVLHHYAIDPLTISWIKGFLSNRSQSVVVDGATSSSHLVTSGVPQGTVLGPALFLCYINSMPVGIDSAVRLFADDTVIYRQITSAEDHAILQQDLQKLARWEAEFSMEFHPQKCSVLRVSRSKTPSLFDYTLHGTNLQTTESTKYLGVTITNDLTWERHISNIKAKANQQLAFVRRNIRTRSRSTKEKLFNTLVRPHVEYAAPVWDPHTNRHQQALEMIQRRAARWVCGRNHNTSSVTDMLHDLGWRSLEHRRAISRLCMLFQICNGSIAIPHDPYLLPSKHTPRPSRHTNTHTLTTYQCRTNYFKFSFFPRTIVLWNALPNNVATSPSLDAFKAALGRDAQLAF